VQQKETFKKKTHTVVKSLGKFHQTFEE
jgi:hypothetical protein